MSKLGVFGIFLILTLFFLSSISAVPPPQTNVNTQVGLEVEYTEIDIIEQNQFHLFNAHVFNISTGLELDNSSTTCVFSLFDNVGYHIINEVLMNYELDAKDWDYNVSAGNFTRNGEYSFLIHCNTTSYGGFVSVDMEVTPNGLILDEGKALLYGFSLLAVLFIFVLNLYFVIGLPWVNRRDNDDKIIGINKLKYIKLGLIPISYGLFNWLLNLLLIISEYLDQTQFYNFFAMLFRITTSMAWVVAVVWTIVFLIVLKNDSKIMKTLKFRP